MIFIFANYLRNNFYISIRKWAGYECRKQKQRQWVVRMSEENRQTPNAYFLTLTIDDKSYKQLKQKYKLKDDNYRIK